VRDLVGAGMGGNHRVDPLGQVGVDAA